MNRYKKYILFALVIPLPFIVLLAINLYLYDPVQIFHKPYFRKTTFFSDMRAAARGIIEHYSFDSYVIGTSMLENTSAKEAKEKLGGEWVNIAMSGSTHTERAIVMQYLFSIKQPKQILYSLDYWNAIKDNRVPIRLYDDSVWNDFTFYINNKFILCSLVWNQKKRCVGDFKADIKESLVSWKERMKERFGGIQNWDQLNLRYFINAYYNKVPSDRLFKPLFMKDYIENILRFVKQNKQTQFYFVMPTYSRLEYKNALRQNVQNFAHFASILSWLVLEIERLPNASLYGFDDMDYADEITNYKDLLHYNADMNSMQLDAIRDNTHRLTSENIEEYLQIMERKIQEYDIEPLVKIAKEALENK